MNNHDIEYFKSKFLAKFNSEKTIEIAKIKAVTAAVQHNKIYKSSDIAVLEKNKIREYWFDQLDNFKDRYGFYHAPEIFIDHVIEFRDQFLSARSEVFFLISHAQKSLSVYAKHLWCMGIIDQPAICPVDRVILSKTNCPIDKRSWTRINKKSDYLEQVSFIVQMARLNGQSIADWELQNF